jgi:hypothetical protein
MARRVGRIIATRQPPMAHPSLFLGHDHETNKRGYHRRTTTEGTETVNDRSQIV